jgi:hypothetical protein
MKKLCKRCHELVCGYPATDIHAHYLEGLFGPCEHCGCYVEDGWKCMGYDLRQQA